MVKPRLAATPEDVSLCVCVCVHPAAPGSEGSLTGQREDKGCNTGAVVVTDLVTTWQWVLHVNLIFLGGKIWEDNWERPA